MEDALLSRLDELADDFLGSAYVSLTPAEFERLCLSFTVLRDEIGAGLTEAKEALKSQRDSLEKERAVAVSKLQFQVAGLRALMDKHPEALRAIADAESPDVIVLQEHKLQAAHVDDLTAKLREILPEYPTARFAVSTAKKGYSGVAVLARARVEEDDTAAGGARGGERGGGGGISKFFQKKTTSTSESSTLTPTDKSSARMRNLGLGVGVG